MPGAQRGKRVRVGQDQARRVERPDQVLPFWQVDAGLAAHRAVDLGYKCGGQVDQPHAAEEARRDEAGDVAHHAAAQRDNHGAAVSAGAYELAAEPLNGGQSL